ncbi:DUF2785 domain-containing protein [Paenibacillus jiagnxiensis]|uniref:DUF2785 domain-containing protein n=1 Tax=Paenibacillus jiagnxiensis TaxID=3228926 RepID=UPI0033B06CFE
MSLIPGNVSSRMTGRINERCSKLAITNDERNLKETLIKIKGQLGNRPDNTELYGLAMYMMNHIGSTDAVLRDELIYSLLSEWVLADLFSLDQLKELLHTAMDGSHLFYRIGEKGADSVFTRSFSVLIIPLILISDRKSSFLTQQDIIKIYDRLIDYCKSEKDTRGYVAGKGWAHSVAHTADAFEDLVQSPYIEQKHLIQILEILQHKICYSDEIYLYEEDERIAAAVVRALDRKLLDIKEVEQWLLSFYAVPDFDRLPESAVLRMNVKHFLKTLYFRLLDHGELDESVHIIKKMISM